MYKGKLSFISRKTEKINDNEKKKKRERENKTSRTIKSHLPTLIPMFK